MLFTQNSLDKHAAHLQSQPSHQTIRSGLAALAAAVLLVACGGGGGDSPSSAVKPPAATTPVAPVAPVVNNYELQTTVPAPTYAAGSWQEWAFNFLNEQRGRCGFGKLAQDPALDKAAQGHAEYLGRVIDESGGSYSISLSAHSQVEGRPLFTGVTPRDRATAAGYSGALVFEMIAMGYTRSDATSRMAMVRDRMHSLLSAPYHMDFMMSSTRTVGLGLRAYSPAENPKGIHLLEPLVVNPGVQRFPQASTSEVLSYPCEGTTDVSEALYGEIPDPTAGTGLSLPAGPAILVVSPVGTTMKITSVSVVPVSRLNGTPLGTLPSFNLAAAAPSGVLVLDRDTDKVNTMINDRAKTYLLTHKPLEMGVTYRVELGFTVDGAAKTKVFNFSTRTSNPIGSTTPP